MAKGYRSTYTVSYDSESHWGVITQRWGSSWPKVFPYCVFNVLLMLTLEVIDKHYNGMHIVAISSQGHTFLTLVVAFLLVSRVSIGLNRYNQARDHLGTMYRESRELIQNCCVFSNHTTDQVAKEWRNEVAYRALLLLRLSMAVIDYPTTTVPAWDVPELRGAELEDIKASLFTNPANRRWAHGKRSEWEETMRVPIRMAYLLRKTIHSQGKVLAMPLALEQENRMLGSIDSFMNGYYGIRTFITTPVPFPLIQMARTFMFLYVFTVPFVLLRDDSSRVAHCFAVFLITYGFMGLEVVSIEMDNPFGDDENDFDNMALAETAYEDTYLTILDVDGSEWADDLRAKMQPNWERPLPTEQSWLMDHCRPH